MTVPGARTFVLVASLVGMAAPAQSPPPAAPPALELGAAIDKLGSLDFAERANAARVIHRTAVAASGPALERAARTHRDEYVRFKALVILAGFGDAATARLMRDLMGDANDRVRMVVYQWFERHPDADVLPKLIGALPTEQSEFVRPALVRAIAASGDNPLARGVLAPLVLRGADFSRGEVIAALGDYDGRYAVADLIEVAKLDGPLEEDAVTALGEIGDRSARPAVVALRKSAPREAQPTIAAALCLLDVDCDVQKTFLKQTLTFAATTDGYEPLLRGVVHALGVLALRGHDDALAALIDAGVSARDAARGPIALGLGLVALRKPALIFAALERRTERQVPVDLVGEAFDMLSAEDFAEELFYVEARRVYWDAPADSARRDVAARLVEKLEF